jgi:putative transposase
MSTPGMFSAKLAESLATVFCLEAPEMALRSARRTHIFHTDQGCQLTSTEFVGREDKEH